MATARPKQARRAGAAARAKPRAARPEPRPEGTAGRHRHELAAIACVALAVFLAFVIYLGWDGGALGRWLAGVTRWLVGLLVFVLPLLLCFVAYLLVARDEQRPRRGVTWGVALIVAAFLLAAAADAFGVFAGERPERLFRDTYMSAHGGVAGEVVWAGLHGVVGRIGVDVLVVALFVAGILLATGSSLRQWGDRSRVGVAAAGSAAGRVARSQAEALGARRRDAAATRVVELDESATVDFSDMLRTSVSPVDEYGPAVSTHAPHLVDGELAAPEIFGDPSPPAPLEPVDEADDGEQLSLGRGRRRRARR